MDKSVKRYSLSLPDEMYGDLQSIAAEEGMTVVELIRKSIKLGLLAIQLQKTPGAALLIRESKNAKPQQVLLI